MTENEFLEAVVDDLEIEEPVGMDTHFRSLEDWCSLMGFSFLVFVSQNFGKTITVNQFLTLNTFRDVYNAAKK